MGVTGSQQAGEKTSLTVYKRHGKGPRQHLRFSKTGDPNLEAAYATHLVRLGQ